jgi:hypothetical protein
MKIIEILKWILLFVAVVSGSMMSDKARDVKGKSKWFANPLDLLDYIDISRKENGRIGSLFWVFLISFISLIALIILPKVE